MVYMEEDEDVITYLESEIDGTVIPGGLTRHESGTYTAIIRTEEGNTESWLVTDDKAYHMLTWAKHDDVRPLINSCPYPRPSPPLSLFKYLQ